GWPPLLAMCERGAGGGGTPVADELEAALAVILPAWPHDLPRGHIHADLFPDNVFFLDGRLSGLIDFYFAATDLYAYDLAVCLNAWCFEADLSFNVTKARALLAGYGTRRPLAPAERAALPVLCQGAALRFALTRLYDWINTPAGALVVRKDPMDYVRRLRFHLSVRDADAYGF
ncbi:phosphotransferase, partial [Acidisphaera rubrifaciens]|uniref:phosphotransferase n=1 Tax=Acidisphaera rubrifaciens TaxID=50715 RepID=UPI000662B6AB